MTEKNVTIKDLAKIAGVSTATVSRALSNPKSVTPSTRESVLQAARDTGYQLNLAARNLRTRQTRTIVVLVPNLGNPFFSRILSGIETAASAAEMNILIVDTSQPERRSDIVRRYLSTARADGIIVMDGALPEGVLEAQRSLNTSPPVVFACEWAPRDRFPSVRTANRNGARLAVRHLLEEGHTKIGYINGPAENVLSVERLKGIREELATQDLALPEAWFFQGDFSIGSGVNAAKSMMALDNKPTAVFSASDMMAIGFISELNRHGIKTPEDISVVAFDDIDIAPHFIPALTTIRQPREDIGSHAVELLISEIGKGPDQPIADPLVLPVELIVRDSTRTLR